MQKPHRFQPSDNDRLSRALRGTDDVKACRRIQAVLLLAQGKTERETARLSAVSLRTVASWRSRYLRHRDIRDLYDTERKGRPLSAPEVTLPCILAELKRSPLNLGYASTGWTVALLASHLSRKYHTSIAPGTLRRRMKGAGLAWKRPRYVFHERAPNIAQKKGRSSGK